MAEETAQRTGYHHGDLRKSLVAAALDIISEKGAGHLTLREIAKRAGVSHAAPYRHFKDKESILTAVAREGFEKMLEISERRIAESSGNELAHFRICGLSYIDFALNYPSHYRVMFEIREKVGILPEDLKAESSTSFKLLYEKIETCQEKGLLKKGDTYLMTLSAWSIVHGFATLYTNRHIAFPGPGGQDLESMKHSVLDSLYFGLRPG